MRTLPKSTRIGRDVALGVLVILLARPGLVLRQRRSSMKRLIIRTCSGYSVGKIQHRLAARRLFVAFAMRQSYSSEGIVGGGNNCMAGLTALAFTRRI
jgi:hypothetical protein